jgi:hypothetical protein
MKGLSYRPSRFEKRFVQYSHNFRIKIIKKRSSHMISIMKVLTTATCLANSELDHSKCISILSKLCLKYLLNVVSLGFLIVEKYGDHSLITLRSERLVNAFECTGWENNYGIDRRVETDLISLTFQKVHSLEIISCESRSSELCVRGWRMYLWIRR